MADQSRILKIYSKNAVPLKLTLLGTAILAFIPSFMIMGTAFARMFACSFVILTALFLIGYAVSLPSNWFEFDDDKKTIRKAFRNRIPYDKIQAIVIAETPKRYTVSVKTNWMPPYPIASGLSKDDAEFAEREFKLRFPSDMIRRESYSKKRFGAIITIALLIVVILLANYFYRLYRMEPPEVVTPEKKEWLTATRPQEGATYQINGINFVLPNRFIQVKEDKEWLYFEDHTSKAKIKVGPGVTQDVNLKHGTVFGFLTGIQSDYDLFRLAYTAHYGLLPSLQNSHAFKELFEIKLYEISRTTLQGIVLQGIKGNKSVAELIVADNARGLHFFLSQPAEIGKISEELLQSIAASIQSGG